MKRVIALALCLLCIFSVTVVAAPVRAPRAAEVYILTDGTLSDKATYVGKEETPAWEDGKNGQLAMLFDGNCYITADVADLTAPFTITTWVKWQGDTADQRLFTLQKKGSENYLSLSPWTDTAVVGKPIANGVTVLTSCYKDEFIRENYYNPAMAGVKDALKANTWHHIAFAVDESTVTLYIDGVNWKSFTLPYAYDELGADTLYIGNSGNGANGFNGNIQAFALYTSVLKPELIAQMANRTTVVDDEETPLVSIYAAATLPSVESLQQEKSATLNTNNEIAFTTNAAAFWECPQIATGQTISGNLIVQNKSGNTVNMQLSQIIFPEAGTPAYQYLSEIKITVMQGDTLLYDGPYTELRAAVLAMRWQQLPSDRSFSYTVTLSRPFTSTTPVVDAMVDWQWSASLFPITRNPLQTAQNNGWLLVVLAASAVAVGFSLYWAIVRRPRRMFTIWDTMAQKVKSLFKKQEKDT